MLKFRDMILLFSPTTLHGISRTPVSPRILLPSINRTTYDFLEFRPVARSGNTTRGDHFSFACLLISRPGLACRSPGASIPQNIHHLSPQRTQGEFLHSMPPDHCDAAAQYAGLSSPSVPEEFIPFIGCPTAILLSKACSVSDATNSLWFFNGRA